MRAHRPLTPSGGLTAAQRLFLLTGMAALVILGVVYWLALISAARSVSDAVGAVSGIFAPPRPTDMPRLGAVFKKSPLESDLETPTPGALLAAAPAADDMPNAAETPTAAASPTTAASETAAPTVTASAEPTVSATAKAAAATATPSGQPTATEAPVASPTADAAPTDQPTAAPTANTAPTAEVATAAGRAPRIVQPQPEPGEVVDAGAVSFSVRVRADAPLASIKAAVDNQAQDATLEQVSDTVYVVRFQATLDAGTHRVWVRASDEADREGSYAWQVQAG